MKTKITSVVLILIGALVLLRSVTGRFEFFGSSNDQNRAFMFSGNASLLWLALGLSILLFGVVIGIYAKKKK